MLPEEKPYCYTQAEETMKKAGAIGHLRVDMGSDGNGFYTSWDDHNSDMNTAHFKAEFNDVINALRHDKEYGGILRNRNSLARYCNTHADSSLGDNSEYYGFRADTDDYSYLIRCNPNNGEYAAYVYAYDKEMLDEVLLPAPELMNVIVVEPEKKPYIKAIKTGLESLQREVSGYIEAVYPFEDPVALIVNEEGKINGLQFNRALRDEDNHIYDIVAGTFLVVGLGDSSFASVPDELMDKYKNKFDPPELFMNIDGKIAVLPLLYEKKESVLDKLAKKSPVPNVSKPKKSKEAER